MSADARPIARRAPSRVDGEVSRERILDAAEHLLAKRGFSGTGISAISRESVFLREAMEDLPKDPKIAGLRAAAGNNYCNTGLRNVNTFVEHLAGY